MIKRMVIAYYDRMLLGLVLIALVTSTGWFWQARVDVRRIRAAAVAVHLSNSAYAPRPIEPSAAPVCASWAKPIAQSAGEGWIYDLFTPPVVFYQRKSASFSVLPPFEIDPVNSPADRESVAVKPELYRLQLAGYFGEPGAYTIVFTKAKRTGPLRAKVGERLADLGISIRQFSVSRVALEHKGHFSGFETVALVELWDEQAGAIVKLDCRHLKYCDPAVATLSPVVSDGELPLSRPATGLVTRKK